MYRVYAPILVTLLIFLSFYNTQIFGRQLTIGDYFGMLLIPFIAHAVNLRWRITPLFMTSIERVWLVLLAAIMIQAIIQGEQSNGTFLNGYRTLFFSLIVYITGRIISEKPREIYAVLIAVYISISALLIYVKHDISQKIGETALHLVGYESNISGLNITNLNTYGLIWALLASFSLTLYFRLNKKKLSLAAAFFPAPYVAFSLSRSAYITYGAIIMYLLYFLWRSDKKRYSLAIPIVLIVFIVAASTGDPLIPAEGHDRISSKFLSFWDELFNGRLGSLMWDPIITFLSIGSIREVLFGLYNSPQHNSIAHYFVMFGLSGLLIYLLLIYCNLRTPLSILIPQGKIFPSQGITDMAKFSLFLYPIIIFNDLATNLLFYYPPFAYLFFFILGTCRPAPILVRN